MIHSKSRALLALTLSGLFLISANAKPTEYPLTIKNCGYSVTFEKAPTRTVAIGQGNIEILYLLGLADKVQGTALWVGPVLKEFTEVNAKIEVLAPNDPSFESVVAKKPELVTNQYQWQVGPIGAVATVEQFEELGIPVYTSPADCVNKDNSEGGDGTRLEPFTMDLIYQEIAELAEIYDVQDRGEQLINELKAREAVAKAKVKNLPKDTSAVFWFSSADIDMDPYMAGDKGAPAYIMSVLGLKNIVNNPDEWPTVGWETVVKANPTIVVAGEMTRRRFPVDDVAVKLNYLNMDPVVSLMDAVQKKRIITLDAQAMNPTIRTMEGIEAVAEALSTLKFDD